MKVFTISYFTPYKENLRGISALIYYLIKYRPTDVDLILYTFNCNHLSDEQVAEVRKELGVELHLIEEPLSHQKNDTAFKKIYHSLFSSEKNFLEIPQSVVNAITDYAPDYIWLYQYYFYKFPILHPEWKFIMTGCDSDALMRHRCLQDDYFRKPFYRYIKCMINERWCRKREMSYSKSNCTLHLVGQKDLSYFKQINNQTKAFYSTHPHYVYLQKDIRFSDDKVRVLLAGNNDFYMSTQGKMLFEKICMNHYQLIDKIKISFLGKGWEGIIDSLSKQGFECNKIGWVDNYSEEIIKYDVQLVPIGIGTGTKGKVLDAMSNGLLVIGTPYAMENIDEVGEGSIVYEDASIVPNILVDIYNRRSYYEQVAEIGRKKVLSNHNPEKCSKLFFDQFKSHENHTL